MVIRQTFWFQTEFQVLYIDYGNTDQVRLNDIRIIPQELVEVKTMALHCSLHGFEKDSVSFHPFSPVQ